MKTKQQLNNFTNQPTTNTKRSNTMATVTITWKAFSNNERPITSANVFIPSEINVWNELGLCELLYEVTNLQDEIYDFTGNKTKLFIWNLLQPLLPANRTHTSLSIGDEITINENTYRCADVGWKQLATISKTVIDENGKPKWVTYTTELENVNG